MKKIIGLTAALAFSMSSVAFGATLSDVGGKVLVNQGNGFVVAKAGVVLNPGDKVMVGSEAFAVVSYEQCAVSIDKPSVVSISDKAPCDAATISPVADVVGGAPYIAPVGLPIPVILVGTGVIVGGVLLASGVLSDDNNCGVSAC